MAASLLSRLSAKARIASPFIRSGVRQGLKFNAIAHFLKTKDLGLRSTELAQLLRRERELLQHGKNLRFLPFNRTPDPSKLPLSVTTQRRKYAYTVQVFGFLSDTGATFARHITISTNSLLTRRETELQATDVILSGFNEYNLEVDAVQLEFVQKAEVFAER